MKKIVIKFLKSIFWGLYLFPKLVAKLIFNKKYFNSSQTYFPERKLKSKLIILLEQVIHIIRWGTIEEYYFLYGFDVKGLRKKSDYLDYRYFMRRRDYLNNNLNDYSYTGVLRDKFYFAVFMEKLGFNIPKTLGLINKQKLFLLKQSITIPIEEIVKYAGDYICKPLDGIGGIGIFLLKVKEGVLYKDNQEISTDDLHTFIGENRFLVQERIQEQHPAMASLYPKSINTLRITTARSLKTGKIEIMGCMLLMGARGALVSNWHYGGVIIDVKDDGSLDKFGFSLYEKKITQHPETGVVFETFKVPHFNEAVKESIRCHEMFYGVHSVGWDIAILPDQIQFIEGNDNWGMAAHQMVAGGLASKFKEYYYE